MLQTETNQKVSLMQLRITQKIDLLLSSCKHLWEFLKRMLLS